MSFCNECHECMHICFVSSATRNLFCHKISSHPCGSGHITNARREGILCNMFFACHARISENRRNLCKKLSVCCVGISGIHRSLGKIYSACHADKKLHPHILCSNVFFDRGGTNPSHRILCIDASPYRGGSVCAPWQVSELYLRY